MKKAPLTLLVALLAVATSFAQTPRPEVGQKFPTFISLEEPVSLHQRADLFHDHFAMTPDDELRPSQSDQDALGFTHDRFQQYYKGVKVEGAVYTVHSRGGKVLHMSGNYRSVKNLSTAPSLSVNQALQRALDHVGARQYQWENGQPESELVVLADPEGQAPARLAYRYDIYAVAPLFRAYVFVDAHNGEVIAEHARIHETNVPATGNSLYNGNVSFTADQVSAASFRLRQTALGGGVETYDLNNSTNYANAVDITSSSSNFTGNNTGVQAHYGAEQTYLYFFNSHGRNSYNNAGGVLRSYVSYSTNYVNAFWDGTRMTYGDGDGVNYGPLVSLDITGHEISHGVTEYSANLVYQRESGALNESFSDIFGEMVEYYATGNNDWQMGTDIGIGGSGAIRSMNNPNAFNDPDTYGGSFWVNPSCSFPSQSNDYCGVHTNSGVQNKWFYILAMGETGTNDLGNAYNVTGIGRVKAAAIAYRNLTTYLSTSSTFADARAGAIQAARDLYGAGSAEEVATTNAWYAVGVGGEYGTVSYCSSRGSNATYEWIAGVTIGSFTNNSGSAGYTNFTSLTVNLNAGQSYNVSLTPGFGSTTYNEYWKIWIDYNADGDFSDAGELAFDAGGLSNTTVNGTLSIPAGATGSTRMRVSMKYNAAQTACEVFSYGEVEDYTVTFGSGGGGDTQPPTNPANLTASNTTQTTTDLSWTASTDNVGVTGYNIYVDGSNIGSVTGTSANITGLTPGTTYAMYVTATDAAGNESGASNTVNVTTQGSGGGGSTTLIGSFFETGWDGWSDGGGDCARYAGTLSWEGTYSIQIRDNSGTASAMTTSSSYNVSSYSQIDIEFYFYPNGMETGEDFWVRYYDGSVWRTVASYARGTSFNNGSFYVATVTISNAQYNFPTNAQFRFQCDASDNSDQIYIDAVTITASNPAGLLAGGQSGQTIRELSAPAPVSTFVEDDPAATAGSFRLYPNPASDELNLALDGEIRSIRIFASTGAMLRKIETFERGQSIDISGLEPGIYFLSVETGQEVINRKFIKQ